MQMEENNRKKMKEKQEEGRFHEQVRSHQVIQGEMSMLEKQRRKDEQRRYD
jgi:hypothetical protein